MVKHSLRGRAIRSFRLPKMMLKNPKMMINKVTTNQQNLTEILSHPQATSLNLNLTLKHTTRNNPQTHNMVAVTGKDTQQAPIRP